MNAATRTPPVTDRGRRRAVPWPDRALRIGICGSVAVSGYVHYDLYRAGYRYIPVIGPSFLLQAAASLAIVVLLLLGGPLTLRIAAAGLAAGALTAFVLSRTVGIVGFTEVGWQPAPQAAISVAAEVATVLVCAASLLPTARTRFGRRTRGSTPDTTLRESDRHGGPRDSGRCRPPDR